MSSYIGDPPRHDQVHAMVNAALGNIKGQTPRYGFAIVYQPIEFLEGPDAKGNAEARRTGRPKVLTNGMSNDAVLDLLKIGVETVESHPDGGKRCDVTEETYDA